MNDGGKIIKNCIEYARQADIQNGEQGGKNMRNLIGIAAAMGR